METLTTKPIIGLDALHSPTCWPRLWDGSGTTLSFVRRIGTLSFMLVFMWGNAFFLPFFSLDSTDAFSARNETKTGLRARFSLQPTNQPGIIFLLLSATLPGFGVVVTLGLSCGLRYVSGLAAVERLQQDCVCHRCAYAALPKHKPSSCAD